MTSTQMRYLIAMTEKQHGKERSIADVSRLFNVNRSTVSRAIAPFIANGILDENYELTSYGKVFVKVFVKKHENIKYWLISRGVSEEKAQEDAMMIATECSDETALLIAQSGDYYKFIKGFQKKNKNTELPGKLLKKRIPENEYHVEFCFCEDTVSRPQEVHLLDTVFYHPAMIKIDNDNAVLRLRKNAAECLIMDNIFEFSKGKPYLEYKCGDYTKQIHLNEDIVEVNLNEVRFCELSENNNLQGRLELTYIVPEKNEEYFKTKILLIIYL